MRLLVWFSLVKIRQINQNSDIKTFSFIAKIDSLVLHDFPRATKKCRISWTIQQCFDFLKPDDTSELGLESRYLSSPGSSTLAGLGSSNLGLQKQQLLLQQRAEQQRRLALLKQQRLKQQMLKQQQQFMSKQPTFSDISANAAIDKSDNLDFNPTDYYDTYDDG